MESTLTLTAHDTRTAPNHALDDHQPVTARGFTDVKCAGSTMRRQRRPLPERTCRATGRSSRARARLAGCRVGLGNLLRRPSPTDADRATRTATSPARRRQATHWFRWASVRSFRWVRLVVSGRPAGRPHATRTGQAKTVDALSRPANRFCPAPQAQPAPHAIARSARDRLAEKFKQGTSRLDYKERLSGG
jgi:hypothetical protein